MTDTISESPKSIAAFETQAKKDGMLDVDGFFTQEDWEFKLDVLQDSSRVALEAHIAEGPDDHETVLFLKGYLMNSNGIKFTPFSE